MRKIQAVGIVLFMAALVTLCVHLFVTPLADWIIRISGIVMLADAAFLVFSMTKTLLVRKK